jgi:beta-lactamase class A
MSNTSMIRTMTRSQVVLTFILTFLSSPARADEPPSLESRLLPLIKAHKGKVTVAVKNLKTGESFLHDENEPMPTASLIKFPVMVETYRQAAEKQVDLSKPVALKKGDKVPGSGILTTHFTEGATFPLVDAVHLMIVFSYNTATNLVLDEIGLKSTAETMEKMGYPNTKIHSKVFRGSSSVFPERSKIFGLGSTTAAEMVRLCEALQKKELVSPEASEAMYKHMLAAEDKYKFRRLVPESTKIAVKTGDLDACKTAAGIIECGKGPVALCVLTNKNEDQRWIADNAGNRLCAEIAREVFEHFCSEPADKDKTTGNGEP